MIQKKILVLFILASILTACAQLTPSATTPPPVSVPATPTESTGYPPPTSLPTEAYPPPAATPNEPYPGPTQGSTNLTPAQLAAIEAVSKKYNIPAEQISIISTEAVEWPDGCLGVVIPGVMCTMVVTPGFRIILSSSGQQFEIHTNMDGTSVVDAAQQLSTLGFVVNLNGSIQVVNPNIPLGPTYNPAFDGLLPAGGSVSGTAYVLDLNGETKAVAIDPQGSKDLTFIQNPTYGLAVWPGGPGTSPLLAWGTQLTPTATSSSLLVSAPDGSMLETLLTTDSGNLPGSLQLVAESWSADGQWVYFSKEPIGLGGYIPFGGASNLYKVDIKTKQVTEIIPETKAPNPQTCLDALSGNYRFVADHCTQNVITIHDLQAGGKVSIQPPVGVTGYRLMGSARFSPSGDRVAFALSKGNPDNEQGWIAIGESKGGSSRLILTGDTGSYYNVIGWLDDQTLLVQSISLGDPNKINQVFTVSVDGTNISKVADGTFLAVIDNR